MKCFEGGAARSPPPERRKTRKNEKRRGCWPETIKGLERDKRSILRWKKPGQRGQEGGVPEERSGRKMAVQDRFRKGEEKSGGKRSELWSWKGTLNCQAPIGKGDKVEVSWELPITGEN